MKTFDPSYSTSGSFASAGGNKRKKIHFEYEFENLGLITKKDWMKTHLPAIRAYNLTTKEFQDIECDQKVTELQTGVIYTFTFYSDTDTDFEVTPFLKYTGTDKYDDVFYDTRTVLVPSRLYPKFEYYAYGGEAANIVYQTFGGYVNTIQTPKRYKLKWAIPFTIRYPGMISEYWDDWGIGFYYYGEDGNTIKNTQYISVKNNIRRQGNYILQHELYIPVESENDGKKLHVNVNAYLYYTPKGKGGHYMLLGKSLDRFLVKKFTDTHQEADGTWSWVSTKTYLDPHNPDPKYWWMDKKKGFMTEGTESERIEVK